MLEIKPTMQTMHTLVAIGFRPCGRGAYVPSVRLEHPEVSRSSVFLADGPSVECDGQVTQVGPGPVLIANGKGAPNGMSQVLCALGVRSTGEIEDPRGRATEADPYWSGQDLEKLLVQMIARFRRRKP
jgi:hypothetical protein